MSSRRWHQRHQSLHQFRGRERECDSTLGGVLVVTVLEPSESTFGDRSTALHCACHSIAAALFTVVWVASISVALTLGRPSALRESWTLQTQFVGGMSLSVPKELERSTRRANSGVTQWGQIAANGAELFLVVSNSSVDDSTVHTVEREHEKLVGPTLHFVDRSREVTSSSGQTLRFSHAVPNDIADARFVWLWSLVESDRRVVTVMINAVDTSGPQRRALFHRIGKSVHVTGRESR